MAYWSTPPHATLSVTQTWLDKMLVSPLNGVSDFIISLRPSEDGPSDRAIGKIGVWRDNEIGLLLAEQYWGRRFAREALGAALEYLFTSKEMGGRGMESVIADIDPRNWRSRKCLEGVGFVETRFEARTAEIDGEWVDSAFLELRREAWEGRMSKEVGRDVLLDVQSSGAL